MGGGKSIFILHWMFDISLGLSLEKGFKQYVHSILLYRAVCVCNFAIHIWSEN